MEAIVFHSYTDTTIILTFQESEEMRKRVTKINQNEVKSEAIRNQKNNEVLRLHLI